MIVVAIIGLLATIAIPNWVRARTASQNQACINNLRQIDGAVQQWALENKQAFHAAVVTADVIPYLKSQVVCPAGGTTFGNSYLVTFGDVKPTCQKDTANHVMPVDTSN